MRVIVVDDDKIIRMGLIKILNKLFEDIEVVSDFQNGLFAFALLCKFFISVVPKSVP